MGSRLAHVRRLRRFIEESRRFSAYGLLNLWSLSMTNLQILPKSPEDLRPYTRNARTHSPKQIAEIAASIKAFGFNNPVLIDKDNGIVAGHGRVEAAKLLGLATVPTIRLEHLTDAQKRAYILADNKLAEKAGWDREILAIELQNLMEIELDFDISATGFEMPEIDLLVEGLEAKPAKADPADEVPALEDPAVTRLGDIWQIGPHRLICGDATTPETYGRLLAGETAQLVFAQFEREVTGERIRDKIAASKKKGLWMGGVVPHGYRVAERKLIVVPEEAAEVRLIFSRYRDLRSLPALQRDLRERGLVTRTRRLATGRTIGGIPFMLGALVSLLRN